MCGREITANIRYCRHCGTSQIAEPTSYLSMEDKPASETGIDQAAGAYIEKITVIMIDDHLVVQHDLRELLATQSEFEIVGGASSREEAVARCQEYVPDVALMDLMMTGIGGGEATCQIKQVGARTKIIILTSLPIIAISQSGNHGRFTLKWLSQKR